MYPSRLQDWFSSANQKRKFDPASKRDRAEYKFFLENDRWKSQSCPFVLEWPYLMVPDMIKDKLTHHILGAKKRWIFDD